MNQITEILMPAVLQLAGTILMVLAGIIGYQIKKAYVKYIDTQTKKDVVESTVKYVEQVYTDLHGKEKMYKALQRAETIFHDQGIEISAAELETLIEATVKGFNESWKEVA